MIIINTIPRKVIIITTTFIEYDEYFRYVNDDNRFYLAMEERDVV